MKGQRKTLISRIVAGCVLIACVLVVLDVPRPFLSSVIGDMLYTKPPPSALNPPVYPNAEQVRIETNAEGKSKVITFETSDKFETVLAFYKDILLKDYWVNPLRTKLSSDPKNPATTTYYPEDLFEWYQAGPDGPGKLDYRLVIIPIATVTGKTSVEVTVIQIAPP